MKTVEHSLVQDSGHWLFAYRVYVWISLSSFAFFFFVFVLERSFRIPLRER